MLWVVIGHSPLSLDNMPTYVKTLYDFAYSFHMPLFILVSGFLFQMTRLNHYAKDMIATAGQKWTWGTIIIDKLKRLGIPFVVFTIIAMIAKSLFPGDMARQTTISISALVHSVVYPGDGPLGEMWFIATLLWYFALSPLWKIILSNLSLEIIALIGLLILHFVKFDMNGLLCIENVAYYAIYFYLGLLFSKYSLVEIFEKREWLWLGISIVLYPLTRMTGVDLLPAWCAIVGSTCLAFLLDMYLPSSFKSFRDYTYQIFLISIFVQIAVKMVYKRVDMPYIGGYLLCIVLGLYVPVLVSVILEKINWKPLLLCVGLKKEINNYK